jgi:transcription antitermination protein NusB
MKTAKDPRHITRRKIVKELYTVSFNPKTTKLSDSTKIIIKNLAQIDELITKSAPEWPLSKINKVDLAVLRLAVWELVEDKNPTIAIIDEAIELAKEYGSEASPSFVNAVLGKIISHDN